MPNRYSNAWSRVATLLVLALAIAALYVAKVLFLPLAVAALISFILAPMANRLEHWGLNRIGSTAICVALTFLILGLVGWAVTDQAVQLSAQLPAYKQNLREKIRDIRPSSNGVVQRATQTLQELGAEMSAGSPAPNDKAAQTDGVPASRSQNQGGNTAASSGGVPPEPAMPVRVVSMPPTNTWAQIWTVAEPILAPLANLAVIVVLVTFILLGREDLRNRLIELIGRADLRASTEALTDATNRVTRYLRTALLINTIYGCAIGTGLAIIGLPNPLLWGVLGLALRFLPYVGPWIAALVPVTLSLVVFDGWLQPIFVVALFVLMETMVNMVLEPWLYGSSTGVSPMGVILAAMFWTWLWGPVGLVVAVPLTVCLVVAANYVPQLRFLGVLLGEQSSLSPPELIYQRLLAMDDEEASELAREHAAETSLPEFYDDVLLPALRLAKDDYEAERLSDERAEAVMDGLRDLAEETATAGPPPAEEADQGADGMRLRSKVLCVPASDSAGEIAAIMLQQTLARQGLDASVSATKLLANELIERIDQEDIDVVVISIIPPLAVRNGRYLLKKLRLAYPDLPVILGVWQGERLTRSKERLNADGATDVVFNLREAARVVRQAALRGWSGRRGEGDSTSDESSTASTVGQPHLSRRQVHR